MGVVFRAQITGAEGFSRLVAVKRIHAELARDPGIRDALVTEAHTARRLHHGGIVQILDVGIDEDGPYLVLEHVDGVSLAELLRPRPGAAPAPAPASASASAPAAPPLPIADALHVVESVAAALAYAHGLTDPAGRPEGVVHRDVTPRNILVSRDGVVKLADFGIAKALSAPSYTLPGTCKGSLGYMAPEQARGEPVDARADQFSAGIVLHEMLAGRNPIAARDVEAYHRALSSAVPPLAAAPPVDAALAAIVARATALDPAARYGSMDELRSELEAWRVARKIRTSGESLRATLRERLGGGATVAGPRPLADLLADQLPTEDATKRASPAARRPARGGPRRRAVLVGAGAAGLAALLVAAVLVAGRAPASGGAPDGAGTAVRAADPRDAALAAIADADAAADADPPVAVAPDAPDTAAAARPPPPPRKPGRLKVMVVPWATVSLDGRPLGGVPIDLEVAAGRHRVTLHDPATGDRVEKWIELEPGGLQEVTSW